MTSVLERLRNRPDRTADVTIALDPNDADRHRKAREELTTAKVRHAAKPDDADRLATMDAAAEALEAVEAKIVTIRFDLVAIGPRRLEELMREYPITKPQRVAALSEANGDPSQVPSYNEDTFPPALLAEAVTTITASDAPDDPQKDVTGSQMTELWSGRMSQADRLSLFHTAMMLNQAPSTVGDLGKG